jgi:hypothetical protein
MMRAEETGSDAPMVVWSVSIPDRELRRTIRYQSKDQDCCCADRIQATRLNPFAVRANTVDRKRRRRENLKPRKNTRMTEVLVTLRG